MAREYDHLFKLIIIGDSGVGKTSLWLRFADNVFYDTYMTTIGVDFKIRTINVDGERVKLQIWDTSGRERFGLLTSAFYRRTTGVVVVYDVTRRESFANIQRWLNDIDNNCDVVNRILVGNKIDDSSRKMVMTEDAQAFAWEKDLTLFETSAKENLNVEEMFLAITAQMLQTKKGQQKKEAEQLSTTISLTDKHSGGKKYYCF